MAKREIPLFLFDKERKHNLGECDFVCCTDIDNGFIAKMEYTEESERVTDRMRIGKANNGIRLKMEVKRTIGKNPSDAAIRTLMKKAESLYTEQTQMRVGDRPTDAQMIEFLDAMVAGNRHYLTEAGSDSVERTTVLTSLMMLEAIKDRIRELSGND